MRREECGKGWQIEAVRALGLVLLATLVVRLYLFVYTPVITQDATLYITQAQLMAQGAWLQAQALTNEFEPLFPFSIFLFHTAVSEWELAGRLASLTFGVLAVVPFFLISRDVFGPRVAFGAGILFALHPYFARNSVEALTESAYLFFFLLTVWLAMRAHKTTGMRWYVLCAITILLTRLVRIEGIWLFLVILLFYGLRSLGDLRRQEWAGAGPLLRFCLAFLMITLPILVYIAQVAGTSEISSEKGFGWFGLVLDRISVSLSGHVDLLNGLSSVGQSLALLWKDFIYKFVQTFHPLLLFLAMVPLIKRALREQYSDYFLLTSSIVFVYLCGPFLLWFGGMTPGSHRFFMAPVAVALPWAAVTIEMGAAQMKRSGWSERWLPFSKKGSGIGHRLPVSGDQWGTIILILVVLVLAAKTVKPQRLDKLPIKDAGGWIATQNLKEPFIIADDRRIAFYSKGRLLPVEDTLIKKTALEQRQVAQKLIQQARSRKVRFIFLEGSLDKEVQPIIRASAGVERLKEWRSPYGNGYTLIQLRWDE
ncbi:MAG: glycosyltransferase family 39 protein [Deltaproteobacteria bacterium]|nr:glycosyltransferase family 39 protein [Deltaproteobacteria bacterium]